MAACRTPGARDASASAPLDRSGDTELTEPTITPMFHPSEPTLQRVADLIKGHYQRIDIAMYSMDASDSSPVVKALKDPAVKDRVQNRALRLRMVFEGFGTEDQNKKRSEELDALGIDVRWLASGRKVHHKFAVFDAHTDRPVVVTGSANWSVYSQKNYDENWLFFTGYRGVAYSFAHEFDTLWNASEELGNASGQDTNAALPQVAQDPGHRKAILMPASTGGEAVPEVKAAKGPVRERDTLMISS